MYLKYTSNFLESFLSFNGNFTREFIINWWNDIIQNGRHDHVRSLGIWRVYMVWRSLQNVPFDMHMISLRFYNAVKFLMVSNGLFTHTIQGYFTGTGAIARLPRCQWRNPEWYGQNGRVSNNNKTEQSHYDDVIMDAMVSQITSLAIVYSTVYSSADQRKYQSAASLAFVWGIHRGPVNSPHKWPVTRKMFPFDDVIMCEHTLWGVR